MEEKKIKDEDLERIKELAKRADSEIGFNLEIDFEDSQESLEEISFNLPSDVQNPKESYRLYYGIEGLLKTHLPKGDQYKDLRNMIREEKIIFLTGERKDKYGKRNADSRQTYISSHLQPAFNEIVNWVQSSENYFDLFLRFRNLNIKYGYFKESEKNRYNQKMD